jgi:hypothetical protein
MNLKKLTEKDLLRLYSNVMIELKDRQLIRSTNNPVADYAEKIVSDRLGLKLVSCSNEGYDAIDKKGIRYQIKSRRVSLSKKSKQLGVIRNLKKQSFDFLIAVIFDSEFSVKEFWKIPHPSIEKHARFSAHQNGHILILRDSLLDDSLIKRLV